MIEPSHSQSVIRLRYLDGLRGLAALFVVLNHAYLSTVVDHPEMWPKPVRYFTDLFSRGRYAVDLFIVLSGYCLMLPLVDWRRRTDLKWLVRFIGRRARRIFPPYYAALVLSLLLIAFVPGMNGGSRTRQDFAVPALTRGVVLSHLGLVHNFSTEWIGRIDPPMWSIATEWQIYFVFALLLVPIGSRFGLIAALLLAAIIGCGPHFAGEWMDWACPWLVVLFAMGMTAAVVNFSSHRTAASVRKLPWGWIASWLSLAGLVAAIAIIPWMDQRPFAVDLFYGGATMAAIIYCTTAVQTGRRPWVLRVLESSIVHRLGLISYSLYVIHWPMLMLVLLACRHAGVSLNGCFAIVATVGVATALLVATGFYFAFERPFLRSRVI